MVSVAYVIEQGFFATRSAIKGGRGIKSLSSIENRAYCPRVATDKKKALGNTRFGIWSNITTRNGHSQGTGCTFLSLQNFLVLQLWFVTPWPLTRWPSLTFQETLWRGSRPYPSLLLSGYNHYRRACKICFFFHRTCTSTTLLYWSGYTENTISHVNALLSFPQRTCNPQQWPKMPVLHGGLLPSKDLLACRYAHRVLLVVHTP